MPKTAKKFNERKVEISYTTSPVSEYIGSHVYEIIGIPVHKTMLGIKDKKVVVACKDFGNNPRSCIFEEKVKQINPFKYIESLQNKECNEALIRIVPKINLDKIITMINEIPEEFEGITIISKIRKEFYIKCLKYRYETSLYPTYLEALKLENM